ncbi:MAG: lantibiotic dehydratase family protein [Bacteroidales bacterium]|nr:lantibiotic dehydratase family protein [Bacteroidales bacterium]
MNKMHPYHISDSYILRTPLLPINFIKGILGNNISEANLIEYFKNPIIKEAIFLASPSFYQRLVLWENKKIKDIKEIETLGISLVKYLSRMSSRCTPFGLFAGCSVGTFNNETKINLIKPEKFKRHTRLDMNYLCSLSLTLEKIPEIRENILFYPNSSIYVSNNQIRYIEYKYINGNRNYFTIGVDNSPYLQKILKNSENGEYINNLVEILIDEKISTDEAKGFINELIDSQILLSQLNPSISGKEFTEQLLDVLKKIIPKIESYQSFKSIENLLRVLDDGELGSNMYIYEEIEDAVRKLNAKFDENFLFQTDLFLETETNFLDKNIKDGLYKGIEILNKITEKKSNSYLEEFKNNFYRKYEEEEIPLYEALDPEIGIGYGNKTNLNSDINPLIEDLSIPEQNSKSFISTTAFQDLLFNKYVEAIASKETEIKITDEDLKELKTNWNDLPVTFSSMVEIYKKDKTNDFYIKMDRAGDSSAANIIGRFCHGDQVISSITKEITEFERIFYKEEIVAEIVHLPESRTGNILLRPILREYEIPYLTKSTLNKDFQLDIKDLHISIPNGRYIQLRSKKLNKVIIPRLTTAHNFRFNSLPIYEFLCDLQFQNLRSVIHFDWGFLDSNVGLFPRVTYRNIILSLAYWNIDKDEMKKYVTLKDDELIKVITDWRKQKGIPSYVKLIQGDNELLLNLNNLICIKILFSLIKKQKIFRLEEFLFSSENSIINGPNGYHSNQFIFHFFKSMH